jgi:hypothetical protein
MEVSLTDQNGVLQIDIKEVAEAAARAASSFRLAVTTTRLRGENDVRLMQDVLDQVKEFIDQWDSPLDTMKLRTRGVEITFVQLSELDALKDRLNTVSSIAASITGGGYDVRRTLRSVERISKSVLHAFSSTLDAIARFLVEHQLQGFTDRQVGLVDQSREYVSLALASAAVYRTQNEVEQVAKDVKVAAGATADGSLAAHFESSAATDLKTANGFRKATIAAFSVIIAVSFVWLAFFEIPAEQFDLRDLLKLAITIPLAAFGYYLARQSRHHRDRSNWASDLAIQLRTLEAFIAPLPDEQKSTLRAHLGQRVFGARPLRDDEEGGLPMASLVDFTGKISEIVKSASATRG